MSTKAYIDSATAAIVQPLLDERDRRIAEMEQEVRDKVEGMLERGAEIRELRKQLAALRGAVQTMRERVRERNGSLIVVGAEEYDALTALLEVKDAPEAPRIKQDWQVEWEKQKRK